MAYVKATQDIYIRFSLKEHSEVVLSANDATNLNNQIADCAECGIVSDYADIDEVYLNDDGFKEEGERLTDEYEYEFSIQASLYIHGSYTFYPGKMYLPNGDPGYPDECDWEPEYGWIETLDKAKIINQLLTLPKIGSLIDEDSISISLDDETNEIGDIQTDDEEPDYD